jgi:hypothetical protein
MRDTAFQSQRRLKIFDQATTQKALMDLVNFRKGKNKDLHSQHY